MGVFPHFFSGSPITHLTHLVLPTLPLFTETVKAVKPLVSSAVASLHSVGSIQTTPKNAQPMAVGPAQSPGYNPSGTYLTPPPEYSPSPFAPSPLQYAPAPDTYSPYGGSPPWEYSTILPPAWNPPSVQYSAAPTQQPDRIWEDIAAVAPLFL